MLDLNGAKITGMNAKFDHGPFRPQAAFLQQQMPLVGSALASDNPVILAPSVSDPVSLRKASAFRYFGKVSRRKTRSPPEARRVKEGEHFSIPMPIKNSSLFFLFLAFLVSAQANLNIPALPQDYPIVLVGGTIHPVSSDPIPNAQLIFEEGKITALGREIKLPPGSKTIDIHGKHIYPGFISSNSVLGLTEIGAVRATRDITEPGAVNPNIRAEVSLNPDSELIPVTRSNSVLVALVLPRARREEGLIAGTSAMIRLDGWTSESMTLRAPVGLHIFWPQMNPRALGYFSENIDHEEKLKAVNKLLRTLDESFANARAYLKAKNSNSEDTTFDIRWDAMTPVLEGEIPVFIHAQDLTQIKSAMHWAEKENLRVVLVGGQDAWRIVDQLKENRISVIISQIHQLPLRRWEPYDTPYTNAKKLYEAGVPFCIANDGHTFNAPHERNLPYQAAMAAAHGLPRDEALKAITLYPAQILGVDHRLGSLEVGKDATLFVADGDPLEVMTNIEMAFIDGRPIDLSNRHTRLYQKYLEKYRQLSQP